MTIKEGRKEGRRIKMRRKRGRSRGENDEIGVVTNEEV